MSIETILIKEQNYKSQMVAIKTTVMNFAKEKGWAEIRRGRHANASIRGYMSGFECVIDIEMERINWDDMPDFLTKDTPFTLWSSAIKDENGIRKNINQELYWFTTFGELEKVTPIFLEKAWKMLISLDPKQVLVDWQCPSNSPDSASGFPEPRQRWKL